jgi:hypothetical protein
VGTLTIFDTRERTQIANLRKLETMKRVVIVGRGAWGVRQIDPREALGRITGLPVTEVDKIL